MRREEKEWYDYLWWARKMPPFPKRHFSGAPLALDNYVAGTILTNIACGIKPKAAFAMEGISGRTYERYLQRSRAISSGAENALPARQDQAEIDRYLYAYFELQDMAIQIASIQRTKCEVHLMQGAPTRKLINRTITKSRQVLAGGRIVTLYGETTVQGSNLTEHQPRVHKNFFMKIRMVEPRDPAKGRQKPPL